MQTVTLKARPRKIHGKGPARQLRSEGMVPAVAYGLGAETQSLAIEAKSLRSILLSPRGRNSVIDLQVDEGAAYTVMVKEYTVHPVSRKLLHADFLRIDETTPVVCEVPFRTVGKSKGEAEGGLLLINERSLRVRCLPAQIPDQIEHDVSALVIDDIVKVKDLTLPESVEVLLPLERKLVLCVPPRVLEAEEVAGAEGAEGAEGAAAAEGAEAAEGDKGAKGDKGDS